MHVGHSSVAPCQGLSALLHVSLGMVTPFQGLSAILHVSHGSVAPCQGLSLVHVLRIGNQYIYIYTYIYASYTVSQHFVLSQGRLEFVAIGLQHNLD